MHVMPVFHGSILYMMCPLYTAEASPKEVRGMMTSITGPSFNAGLVTAIFTNVGFSRFSVGWRIAVVVVMVVALVFSVGMKFLPHTPRYKGGRKGGREGGREGGEGRGGKGRGGEGRGERRRGEGGRDGGRGGEGGREGGRKVSGSGTRNRSEKALVCADIF